MKKLNGDSAILGIIGNSNYGHNSGETALDGSRPISLQEEAAAARVAYQDQLLANAAVAAAKMAWQSRWHKIHSELQARAKVEKRVGIIDQTLRAPPLSNDPTLIGVSETIALYNKAFANIDR